MTLPAGKAAQETDSAAPAANSLEEFFAVTNTVNRPHFRVRFNDDKSISIEVPDGRGGVAVHNVSPPIAEPDAAPVWLQIGSEPESLLPRPAEADALTLERATELVPTPAVSLAEPLSQHAPQHWTPTQPRRRLAVAVVGFALLFAAGFYIASPNSAAWLASIGGTGSSANTSKPEAAKARPLPAAVNTGMAPAPGASPVPIAVPEQPSVTAGMSAPALSNGDSIAVVDPPVARSNALQAAPGPVATATLDAAPKVTTPPMPSAPTTGSGDIQKSVEALETSPPSAGTRQPVAGTASSGTRPATPPQAAPAAVAAVTSAANATPIRRTRPAENASPDSPAALAAALGTAAPTRALPPAASRGAACTEALSALGLCNPASSTSKE